MIFGSHLRENANDIIRPKLQKLRQKYPSFVSTFDITEDFKENYMKSDDMYISNSEILYYVNNHDNGVLLCEQLKLKARNLINNVKLDYDNLLENKDNNDNMDNCNTYTISKKYDTLELLNADNDKDIYYDRYYDDTVYDILNVYKKEQNEMEDSEFVDF
jgi:hypothetical protein